MHKREHALQGGPGRVAVFVDEIVGQHTVGTWRDAVRVTRRRIDLDVLEPLAKRPSKGVKTGPRADGIVSEPQAEHADPLALPGRLESLGIDSIPLDLTGRAYADRRRVGLGFRYWAAALGREASRSSPMRRETIDAVALRTSSASSRAP